MLFAVESVVYGDQIYKELHVRMVVKSGLA